MDLNESAVKDYGRVFCYYPEDYVVKYDDFFGPLIAKTFKEILQKHNLSFLEKKITNGIRFFVLDRFYDLIVERSYARRQGDGGERQTLYIFCKDEKPILSSVDFSSWDTTSDDSIEYGGPVSKKTYLLSNDQLAREVFQVILGDHNG